MLQGLCDNLGVKLTIRFLKCHNFFCNMLRSLRLLCLLFLAEIWLATALQDPHGCAFRSDTYEPYIISTPPSATVKLENLPFSFDWRKVNGTVFVTKIHFQSVPKYCGSCWAFAVTSALSDRIKILQRAQEVDINLSVQALIDCQAGGTCHGGSPNAAHAFIHKNGVTDDTCAPYMATDSYFVSQLPCTETMCRYCDRFGNCRAVNATRHYIVEHGTIWPYQVHHMMAEIYTRGPIVCLMYAHSEAFDKYTGGIITEETVYPEITHAVSLVGWGTENGVPYWVGRNSYGTRWGEKGWFRIKRGSNTLLIESGCSWAVPKL